MPTSSIGFMHPSKHTHTSKNHKNKNQTNTNPQGHKKKMSEFHVSDLRIRANTIDLA